MANQTTKTTNKDRNLKIPLSFEQTLQAAMETPPKRKKKLKRKPGAKASKKR